MNCVWSFPGLFWPILANKKNRVPWLSRIEWMTHRWTDLSIMRFSKRSFQIFDNCTSFTQVHQNPNNDLPGWTFLLCIFFLVCGISYQIGTKIEKYKWNQTKTYGRMACRHFLRNCFFFPARWKKKQDFGFWMNEWPTIFSGEKKRYLCPR